MEKFLVKVCDGSELLLATDVQKQHISFNTLQLKLSMGENLLDLQI
jgi:hypothetical protein